MTDNSNKMPTDETLGRAQMDAEKRGKDIESDSRIAKKNQVSKDSQSTYASAAVPAVAAKWIVRILELEGRPELEKILQSDFGLRCCTVRQIKHVWKCLLHCCFSFVVSRLGLHGQPTGRKDVCMAKLRRYFYDDSDCTVVFTLGMIALQHDLERESSAANIILPPSFPMPQVPRHSKRKAILPAPCTPSSLPTRCAPSSCHPLHNTQNTTSCRPWQQGFTTLSTSANARKDVAVYQKRIIEDTSSTYLPQRKRVKCEPKSEIGASYETQPRNSLEANLMMQLCQIGFSNKREVLSCIRRIASNSTDDPPNIDSVMITLVTQREEADEAHKIDKARLLSEQSRKAEARRCRLEIQQQEDERMLNCNLSVLSSNPAMFPQSWILKSRAYNQILLATQSDQKTKGVLLELLKLEKRARTWYNYTLPKAYFGIVVPQRLLQASSLTNQLRTEVATLKAAMFKLSGMRFFYVNCFIGILYTTQSFCFLHFRADKGWCTENFVGGS
jgi:hypothetical protein